MKFEHWTNRLWLLLSTNGEASGVELDCALEFQQGAQGRTGHCHTGHDCAWMSQVPVDYHELSDSVTCTVEVGGKSRTFLIHRYLSTERSAQPVLVARQITGDNRPPGSNEEVGRWTSEEGAGQRTDPRVV